ncbi:MAG: hypothetical protein LBK76_10765 [Verrucomicrobiales bacterium]|nr:hypothetical protein [Verrucomicrobiales bacterium]
MTGSAGILPAVLVLTAGWKPALPVSAGGTPALHIADAQRNPIDTLWSAGVSPAKAAGT